MRAALMPSTLGFGVACALATTTISAGSAEAPLPSQPRTRTVYASVTATDGSAVTDLTAAEFEVKEGGKAREIVSVKPASAPLRVAILDADGGTGAFQSAIGSFMEALLGRAEFALTSVVVQPDRVLDYTTNVDALNLGLGALGRRGQPGGGGQLMDAIQQAIKDVRREGMRPVILVLRIGSEAPSSTSGEEVRDALRKSGATLYAVSPVTANRPAASQARGTDALSKQQGQNADSEFAQSAFNLEQVLGDGVRESGGRHEQVLSATQVKVLRQFADELLHQYEITYLLPSGEKPGDKIAVSSTRKGVTVRAPSRIPTS
jgi:hypothetical protein